MKKLIAMAFIGSLSISAHADVGAFVGITYAFGSNTGVGFTLQATSTRKEERAIAAAGIAYYPFAAKPAFGLPVGVGYQGKNAAVIVNYDFLLKAPSVAGGYVNTRDEPSPAPAATTPPPPPPGA